MRVRLLLALVVLAVPGGADAAFPGGNGRLVFTQWTPTTDRFSQPSAYLCTASPDGSAQSRISGDLDARVLVRDGQPTFSADGSRVAFVRSGISSQFGPIWVAAVDGGGARQLHAGGASSPAWSADGRRIYFSENGDLYTASWPDGALTRLTATTARAELMPATSADGRLAYVDTDAAAPGPRNLVVAAGDGAAARTLVTTDSLREPDWSPDGRTIVFAANDGIWMIAVDGGSLRRLRERGGEPEYSPDGTRIVFADGGEIWTMAAAGGEERRVTDTPVDELHPAWQPAGASPAAAGGRPCAIAGTSGDDVLVGTGDRDIFVGGRGNDVLRGLGGDDIVIDGEGDDTIDGGEGDDLVFFVAGQNEISGGAGADHVSGYRGLALTDSAQIVAGDGGNDELQGSRGRDRLVGGDGNDRISGLRGRDTILAGAGNDWIAGNRGDDYLHAGAGDDVLFGGLISGRPLGYDGYDILLGGGGNDRLAGGWQRDRLFGGPGADRLRGGSNGDLVNGEAGRDDVAGEGGDDVLLGRDRTRDLLAGGPGYDRATADDADVRRGIERRLR